MKDIFEIIKSRRSIRKYKSETPPEELIKRCIEAALYAPSARNSQPWSFIVVKDKEIIKKLSKAQPFTKFLEGAPYVVVALADEKKSNHWLEDMGCAIMALLLEAHSLGLGACWGAIYHPENRERENYVREILNIPENLRIISCIGIGYPDETPSPKRVKSLDEAIIKIV
ncbi:nitroreductase [Thermodesulfovibrio aggregans]|uniref:Nitroreductase n=1 Tax=Thermodesulfovibrio aggregans TaxID=86166 RepID=A0A0U9IAW0_9BACT|nr:nitroreductase family protein [Thermodesulfovibrio aggregans]GAQ95478.1 nitroreductase [Thermodesulfovibrio aggregans]